MKKEEEEEEEEKEEEIKKKRTYTFFLKMILNLMPVVSNWFYSMGANSKSYFNPIFL